MLPSDVTSVCNAQTKSESDPDDSDVRSNDPASQWMNQRCNKSKKALKSLQGSLKHL